MKKKVRANKVFYLYVATNLYSSVYTMHHALMHTNEVPLLFLQFYVRKLSTARV